MIKHGAPFVIAEAGVNHNGDETLAVKLIDAAVAAGADAVKFQTFKTQNLVTTKAVKADYQKLTTDTDQSQFQMLKQLELSYAAHARLKAYCEQCAIHYLSTPFDLESLNFLTEELKLSMIKLPSGEITNGPLLLAAARSGCRLILSTGMSTLDEVADALAVIAYGFDHTPALPPGRAGFQSAFTGVAQEKLATRVCLLHCTTEYPAPMQEINLRAMLTLATRFKLPVGYSDHTQGITAAIAATALGATVIEKHFTLDRELSGPDHKASLEPAELAAMVQAIHDTHAALGDGEKAPSACEQKNLINVRKSLVAATAVKQGETFTAENLACKRPGSGVSPMAYWDFLGTAASRPFNKDEQL